jgi:hypothetical protein
MTYADRMSSSSQPRRAIVLGTSLSGKIASMVLADRLDVTRVIGPRPIHLGSNPEALSGKHAHSHAFLPRFIKEIDDIAPFLSKAFEERGLRRTPASRAFRWRAPLHGTRLRAMRWQVEDVATSEFNKRLSQRVWPAEVVGAVIDGRLTALSMQDGQSLDIDDDTLVVDAMGANSPLMKQISRQPGAPSVEDEPSNIGYVTQLFRLRSAFGSLLLPDPVADCSKHLGRAFVTLYAGAEGWFSVTLAWDIRNRNTSALLRDTSSVIEFASRSPGVARWIAAAMPIGPSRRYMNPRNRWSLPILASNSCPDNYIAVGDALTTTAPTLGAGCSWLASHVRILSESLETGDGWRDRFLETVAAEQRAFFDLSVATGAPAEIEPPPILRPRTGALRVLLSPILDRKHHAQIRDHIVNGSTL